MTHWYTLFIRPALINLILLLLTFASCAQAPAHRPTLRNSEFDKKLTRLLDFSVPLMSVHELRARQGSVVLLDTREEKEYEVSHIPGATYLGYKKFDPTFLDRLSKDTTIVLYCSVGYRSEKIGEKLKSLGYQQVYNLYGSIFEWVNNDYPIINGEGNSTTDVHTYNKNWSKWVDEQKAKKVW